MNRLLLLLLLRLPSTPNAQPLRVAVAANAQFVMAPLRLAFQQKTGQAIESSVNSSRKLSTQIQQDGPYDVFLPTNMTYPQSLHEQGLTTSAPFIYAYGSLVLWTLSELTLTRDLLIVLDPAVRHIAVANHRAWSPSNAPASLKLLHFDTVHVYPGLLPGISFAILLIVYAINKRVTV